MSLFQSAMGSLAPRDQTITDRLFEGLTHRPEETVLIDGPSGRAMTAGALVDMIRGLAGGLIESGRGNGHVVALMAPNIPEFAVVFHGVAYAGGTVTTLNPTYTAHEARHQLIDSGAGTLITVPAFLETARDAIEGTGIDEVHVIGATEDTATGGVPLSTLMGAPLARQAPVDLDSHIVVLPYSSGTTGMPKGVMLTHRNLVTNVDQVLTMIEVEPGELTTAFLPFFHIYGMTVMMNAFLAGGGGLVTMPRFDLEAFLQLAQDHRVKQVYLAPPVALALAKHPLVDQYDLSALEYLVSGAAPLGADVAEAVGRRLGCVAVQAYGMTELSPVTHITPKTAPRPGTVGLTVPGAACRIVDFETGRDLGPNEEGELWIRSPQVMKGYLNNAQATAEAIVEDGWLRTGDVACFDADGYCYIRDRVKELIKVSGFQVAPAELEAELLTHPDVMDAAAIGVPDEEKGEMPVVFVVPAQNAAPSPEAIMGYLRERLTHYKHPREVIFLDEIPKSASGKILRRQLRDRFDRTS